MALRPKLGPGSGVIPGTTFFEEYEAAMKGLFDASAFPLTNVGGSPNDVTADLYWELDAGLIDGMKFTLTWAASNGGPMTLSINGGPTVPILDAGGNALTAGIASAGKRAFIEFIGGAFRILSGGADGGGGEPRYWVFTASGTWEKPVLPDNHMVLVEAWGGGGGGQSSGAGGGGGGYSSLWIRAENLPSVVSVSIGAGGAIGSDGGVTTFGDLLTAYAGAGGSNSYGGGVGSSGSSGGRLGGGAVGAPAGDAGNLWGGGAGGHSSSSGSGGMAVFGGGGGVGGGGVAGISIHGGSGGASGQPGEAPAGGGGRGAVGARGEVRIWA